MPAQKPWRHAGVFPDREEDLLELPGIGPYTAAAIAAIAFGRTASPVDGNVERVVTRLFAIEQELPNAKPAIRELAARLAPDRRPGDFAQAMMDLGATICTPKAPACVLCPFMGSCAARAHGDAETFPRKKKKAEGRLRRGAAYVRCVPTATCWCAGAPPRVAGRHDGSADHRMARRIRRGECARQCAEVCAGKGPRRARSFMAAHSWRGDARVHPFPA